MRVVSNIFFYLLIGSSTVFGQGISKYPLPNEKTISSYTEWLKAALEKYTVHERSMAGGPNSQTTQIEVIKDVIFKNCAIKYRASTTYRSGSSSTFEFGKASGGTSYSESYTENVFDFGQLNKDRSRVVKSIYSGMDDILLETVGKANIIHWGSNSGGSGTRSSVRWTVKKRSAEVIVGVVNTLIGICSPNQKTEK